MDADLVLFMLTLQHMVAFRKEGVDADPCDKRDNLLDMESPSARKVWMLIGNSWSISVRASVAFRKEGVD